jgi:GGDEF domain-containing protein
MRPRLSNRQRQVLFLAVGINYDLRGPAALPWLRTLGRRQQALFIWRTRPRPRGVNFKLSAGVAELTTLSTQQRQVEIVWALLENADAALCTAKGAGGNRVRIFH